MEINKLKELQKGTNVFDAAAKLIVNLRYVIFVLFAIAGIYCFLSINRVKINSDLTAFLPAQAETRRGLTVMEDEFVTYGTAQVMISNVTFERAQAVAEEIGAVEHVTGVAFDNTRAHYKNAAALFTVSFDGTDNDPALAAAMERIGEIIAPYDHAVQSEVGSDYSKTLAGEITGVLLIAVVVILAVLFFTSSAPRASLRSFRSSASTCRRPTAPRRS